MACCSSFWIYMLCMNNIHNSIKEACQYVGIIALACGSALVLLIMGNKRKC